jgi:tRNA 5-methylaminomethyl-2-thiouridine biosynthesis bifunctional protein
MAGPSALIPARLSFDAGGVPHAEAFGDVYHSTDGGPAQARHVFLGGNGLPERWHGRGAFTIVETGFGLGLNFLSTCAALIADPASPARLHYVSVEKHPPTRADLERAHSQWPESAELARELCRGWPPLMRGFHRIEFARGRIVLTLLLGDAAELLAELDAQADAIFLDGFAPEKNPDMWSDAVFRELTRLSGAGTTAATWTVAGAVRARLRQSGFLVEKRPGFGRKREMLSAVRTDGASPSAGTRTTQRRAIVIGAGLAGAWCTHALTRRGWHVELIERHSGPAREASGNAVGALRPALNLADNENARLARTAFLLATAQLASEPALEAAGARTGVLHVATSPAQAERMARILALHAFPDDYVRWVDAKEAAHLAGHTVAGPGWWIERGGWTQPPALCDALLDCAPDRITRRFGQSAARVASTSHGWGVLDARGHTIVEAPVLVLANAFDASRLGVPEVPQLICVRGQVSHLPAAAERRLNVVICGDGYVAPLPGGGQCVGATFEPESTDVALRDPDHLLNLARLDRMLPGFGAGLAAADLDGRVALRTATADRLPACGPLPQGTGHTNPMSSLLLLAGLGARGLIWAPLCAEILASQLDAEPNPVEHSLIAAMNPTRL